MKILGRIPTVPEYYKEFINSSVELLDAPKQCCPFHEENTPSFSYNIETGRWSCFGKCHAHGDVVGMHMRHFKLSSRTEAQKSLNAIYEVEAPSTLDDVIDRSKFFTNEKKVRSNIAYSKAVAMANTPERWLQLDYVMSIHPFETYRLYELMEDWGYGS